MALTRKMGAPQKRRFQVYDFEWTPADLEKAAAHNLEPMKLRLCGLFDGKNYWCTNNIKDFLNRVCTRDNSGSWFYAHAGGLYDVAYILEYLVANPKEGITIDCAFSGSAAIIVRVRRGTGHGRQEWTFVDSFWLIRQSLREIGEWLGMSKGGDEGETETFYAPWDQLKDYNEQDCRILFHAIETFQQSINELGGELQRTIAATALDLFRRRFLKEDILTGEEVNEIGRAAYYASRVEVFEQEVKHADFYDINSSFPHAMTFDAPGTLKRRGKRLKDHELSIARCKVTMPDCHVPVMPKRGDDDRIYFPVGTWEGWYNNVDIEFLQENGGRVEKITDVLAFHPFSDMAEYSRTLYEWRRTTKSPALKVVLKFLLNSLYGKTAEGSLKQKVMIHPPKSFFDKHPERMPGGTGREMLMPGVWALVEDREVPHAHVPIAAHITAIGRRSLGQYLVRVPPYYCDTDGFGTQRGLDLPTSDVLGELKGEPQVWQSRNAAPKLYTHRHYPDCTCGKCKKVREKAEKKGEILPEDGFWHTKGKGYSRLDYKQFCDLLEHRDIPIEQFARLRTMFRDGDVTPHERTIEKTWTGKARPKRRPEGTSSVPWHVKQIMGEAA